MMIEKFYLHPIYYGLTTISALLLLLLSWNLWHGVTTGTLLFVGVAIVTTLWFLSVLGTRILLSPTELTVHRPLWFGRHSTRTVAHRQLVSVDRSGRFLAVLTLLYYPMQQDGLLDLEALASVTLPMVSDQATLRERLEAAIPR